MFGIFKSELRKALDREQATFRKFTFYCLYEVAAADGVDQSELNWLAEVMTDLGISQADLHNLKNDVRNGTVAMPTSHDSRTRIIWLMVRMILADGEVTKPEVMVAMTLAEMMGFEPGIILEILTDLAAKVENAYERERATRAASEFAFLLRRRQ